MHRGIVFLLALLAMLSGCVTSESNQEVIGQPAGATSTGNYVPRYSSSFDQKWSTEVTRDEMIETALFNLFTGLDAIKASECELMATIVPGSPTLEEHHYLLEDIADGIIGSFCSYMSRDITVISGRYDFVKKVVAEYQLESDQFGGVCGYDLEEDYAMACIWGDTAWVGISLGSIRNGQPFIEERRLTIAAHEIFHIVQEQIDPFGNANGFCDQSERFETTVGDRCMRPLWFVEGAAEFMGRALTQYFGLQNYATFVPDDRNGYFLDPDYLSDLGALSIRGNVAGGVEGYYSGAIATEFILANSDLESYLSVYKLMGEGHSFFDAFEMALGISVQEFHELFRSLHLRLYDEAGYCESSPGCSEWTRSKQLPDIPGLLEDFYQTGAGARLVSPPDLGAEEGLTNSCFDEHEAWWLECMGMPFPLPTEPENSGHGFSVSPGKIPSVETCEQMAKIGDGLDGLAATFQARESSGATNAFVSTEYYAFLGHLDTNRDGVVCSSQAPEI